MPTPSDGDIVPLVTSPPPTTGLPWRGDAGPVHDEGDELLGRARLAHGAHGVGADEARVLLARPAEAGLDRAARLHQVVAVEVEADLEAQRVARAEAGRRRAARDERVPDRAGVAGRDEQLDAVLAGVAGAADERGAPATCGSTRGEALGQRAPSASAGDDLARARALHGEHRVVVEAVGDLDVEAARRARGTTRGPRRGWPRW